MKTPSFLREGAASFDRMTARERIIVTVALFAGFTMLWMTVSFDPQAAREHALTVELTSLKTQVDASALALTAGADPLAAKRGKEAELIAALAAVDGELASESAGLIAPERMIKVVRDVLARQRSVALVSLHNKPVVSLAPPAAGQSQAGSGPFVHRIELVVEGEYLDVLAYLQALEHLDWRFYWKALELETTGYPLNRVRIEMSTLSLEREWLGV